MDSYCGYLWYPNVSSVYRIIVLTHCRNSSGVSRAPAGHRQHRQTGNQDDDSSGLSETNEGSRKATLDRIQPQFSPLEDQQNHHQSATEEQDNKKVDTSDSTDTESYGKRRRIKTKHELDRMKSSSNSHLLTENTAPSSGNVINMPPNSESLSSDNMNLPQNTNTGMDRQHSEDHVLLPSAQHSQSLPRPTSLSVSYDSLQMRTLKQNSGIVNVPQSVSDINQNGTPMNGLSSPQRSTVKLTGLSREMSLSSHSSSQSDLVREGEGVAMEKRGHVVYHWAMIQLCMSQEMERFMQDIVSLGHN